MTRALSPRPSRRQRSSAGADESAAATDGGGDTRGQLACRRPPRGRPGHRRRRRGRRSSGATLRPSCLSGPFAAAAPPWPPSRPRPGPPRRDGPGLSGGGALALAASAARHRPPPPCRRRLETRRRLLARGPTPHPACAALGSSGAAGRRLPARGASPRLAGVCSLGGRAGGRQPPGQTRRAAWARRARPRPRRRPRAAVRRDSLRELGEWGAARVHPGPDRRSVSAVAARRAGSAAECRRRPAVPRWISGSYRRMCASRSCFTARCTTAPGRPHARRVQPGEN